MNLTFIALATRAIHHSLSALKTGKFRVLPGCGPGSGAQSNWDTRTNNHMVNNTCRDVFRGLNADFRSSLPEVQAKKIDNIHTMICRSIHLTGTDPAMTQCHNDQCNLDEGFLHCVPDVLIEHPNDSFHCLRSCVAPSEASMRYQLFCRLVGLPLPAAASPSPAAIATETATTTPT